MNAIIGAEGLTKAFGNSARAVDGATFSVGEGEVFSLLGPNGAGKTTTIRMLTTLTSISEGTAAIGGHDVRKDPGAVRKIIGIVPQEVTLDNELKGVENLMLAAKLQHVTASDAKSRSAELFHLVELDGFADRRVSTYSGGMKRRLQLIAALVHRPRILFLDEPTVGLDVQTRTRIWDYITKLSEEQGVTIFMTTHYLEEADSLSDTVAIMDHGTIKIAGTPAELKENLHGDVLTLSLEDGGEDLTRFLESTPNVTSVTRSGSSYRLKLPGVESALPQIVTTIASKGIKISGTSFTKPTLDQVFLEVTGRSMRDAEDGNGHSGSSAGIKRREAK